MTARRNNGRDFTSFSLGLDRAGPVVSKGRNTDDTHGLRELWVTVTFEGSHLKGLILTLAKASKKEVK